jgi:hypothetical protein
MDEPELVSDDWRELEDYQETSSYSVSVKLVCKGCHIGHCLRKMVKR